MSGAPPIEGGGSLIVAWQLRGRRVLLIGGGEVAAGRLVLLKTADAHVTVLAPRDGLCAAVQQRLREGAVDAYIDAAYTHDAQLVQGDGRPYDMVLTAIDDAVRSREVCAWCRARRVPVNVADVPPACDFYFGSMIRRGPLQVMVSTGGRGPRLARIVRERIEAAVPAEVGAAITRVGALRTALRRAAPDDELAPARMQWMSRVCDAYSFEQLAALDDAAVAWLVEDAWPARAVPPWPSACGAACRAHEIFARVLPRCLCGRFFACRFVSLRECLAFAAGAALVWCLCGRVRR